MTRVVQAALGQAGELAELIATAFTPLAAASWLVPRAADRQRVLTGHVQILVSHALAGHGRVDRLDDGSGVAVWFDHTNGTVPAPSRYDDRLSSMCAPYDGRIRVLDDLFAIHQPDTPHHHLAFLAVHPTRQRQGLGTILLNHHHDLLDAVGTPAYLEASSEASRRLYCGSGYTAGPPFSLPEGPPFWPMWREPLALPPVPATPR